jgi:hypothetical protein
MSVNDLRHMGDYQGSKVIVLGYNRAEDKVMLIKPETFNSQDQNWLGEIVNSGYAQSQDSLIKSLAREQHSSGQDGFTYVVTFGRPIRVSPHEIRLYDRNQAIKWFGGPNNYASSFDRRGADTSPPMSPSSTAEYIFPPKAQVPNQARSIQEAIEPAMPMPSLNSAPQIPGVTIPVARKDPPPVSPGVSVSEFHDHALDLAPYTIRDNDRTVDAEMLNALKTATAALTSAAEKLEKTLDLDRRLKQVEKKSTGRRRRSNKPETSGDQEAA